MSEDDVLLIESKDLPLKAGRLQEVQAFCEEAKAKGRLIVSEEAGATINGLRTEYLDQSLPLPERAIGHVKQNPEEWRKILVRACKEVVKTLISIGHDPKDFLVHYLWRAGLFFLPGFCDLGVTKNFHFGLRRDEKNPHKTAEIYLPLSKKISLWLLLRHIVADIMLATGGSGMAIIDRLIDLGVKQLKIIFVCLIAAPEGVYNLLRRYPDITIVAGCLDDKLDGNGYIVPGLGDAGDKGFYALLIGFFSDYRKYFSDQVWQLLKQLVDRANPKTSKE